MKTLFIGQNLIYLKSIDSTNSYANELLEQINPLEGTLIYTFNQEKGRGQRGNRWECEANKNVALSIILNPSSLKLDEQFLLNKFVSLAVADLLAEITSSNGKKQEVKIKWPNDIFINNKKIAGILIENTIRESTIQHTVIGIGININQTQFNSDINATSLSLLLNKEFDLLLIIESLCEFIEARYLQLKSNNRGDINQAYLHQLYLFNEWHNYTSNNTVFEGKIIDISKIGKLQLQLKSGEVKDFDLKEIKLF